MFRGASISVEFYQLITGLIKGKDEGFNLYRNLLYDLAHQMGSSDCRNFNTKMDNEIPIQKLSAGPVLFAFTGFARVELSKGKRPFHLNSLTISTIL